MRIPIFPIFIVLADLFTATAAAGEVITLIPGYLTKVQCEGRLLVSAIGNESLVRLEALPKELGCGVLLKAMVEQGRTNLILETSAGTIQRLVEISPSSRAPTTSQLEYRLKGDSR